MDVVGVAHWLGVKVATPLVAMGVPLRVMEAELVWLMLRVGLTVALAVQESWLEEDFESVLVELRVALKAGQSRDAASRAAPAQQQQPADAQDDAPPAPKGSLLSGALEEAGLITWPSVKGVISTTAAVFGIVVVSTLLLLSVNALLATLSEKLFG